MKKLIWFACACALIFTFGCSKKQNPPEPLDLWTKKPSETAQEKPAGGDMMAGEKTQDVPPAPLCPSPMEIFEENYSKLPTKHTVVKGECLWWIAEYKEIYNDPFMWPLIYKANRDQINNPDLIYPGQVFEIPREFSMNELKESRRQAGAPRPYTPPNTARLPYDLSKDLGWCE